MKIALFATCIGDTMFPEEQTCCGQMHLNSGYAREAEKLGRRFRSIFGEYEAVVSPSSSCVGTVRETLGMENVFELSELLVRKLGVDDDPVAAFRDGGYGDALARRRGTASVESAYEQL